jgi:hypothetical protein
MASSAQTIAASGMVNGQGVAASSDAQAQYNANNAKAIVVVIDGMFSNWPNGQPKLAPNTVSNVAGLYDTMKPIPSWVTGRNGYKKVSGEASAQSKQIMGTPGDPNSVKNFSTTVNQGAGYGQATLGWHASINQYQGKKFDDFGLNNKSYQDIASGGMTGHFSGLKKSPGGASTGFGDLGSFIAGQGNGIDVAKLSDMFGPANLVVRMRKNGLGAIGAVDANLATLKIYTDAEVKKADYRLIKRVLDSATDAAGIGIVISTLEIKVPQNVKIEKLGDLVDSNKMLPPGLRTLAPGGNMAELNGAFGSMGGNFSSAKKLGEHLGRTEVPEYPKLDALKNPLPSEFITNLAPAIGFGSLPSFDGVSAPIGTGPLGNPTLTDMLGSASGTGFTDNYKKINAAHDKIMNSQVGQDLYNKLKLIYEADKTPPFMVSQGEVIELGNIIKDFNKAVKDDPELKKAQLAMAGSVMQMARSSALLPMAGIDLASPPQVSGMTGVLNMAASLPKYGVDKQQMGFNQTFTGVADKSSVYGEAVLASMLEGRNAARATSAGVPNNITADPIKMLAEKAAANKAKGLTAQQKENIIDYAKKQGKDPSQAISNSELFGYQNNFYVSKGYPAA